MLFWLVFILFYVNTMRGDSVPEVSRLEQEGSLPRWERLQRYAELARLWLSQDLDENSREGTSIAEYEQLRNIWSISFNII